jgi:surface protein
MSSPLYPLGMNSYNNRLPQGGYKSWKGTGVFSNPTGVTAGNIRPLTNNDPTNNAPQKFGLPRPIQHYRKGITVTSLDNSNDSRQVKSSTGGGSLVGQMIDIPGGFSIKENPPNETSNTEELDKDCKTCQGVGIISDWQPITDLTEKPEPETQSREYCCNQERNALRRARSSNTKLKKNYYTTTANYLYNRCQTFEQKQFNYLSTGNTTAKPGAPLSQNNTYNANCNPNLEIQFTESQLPDGITLTPSNPLGCERVQYHPNNYKYAQQGAVSSSDRMLRLNVETIDTNRANIIKNRENLTKSKYFPNASGSSSSNDYDECCNIIPRVLVRQGTFILDITYNENGAFFRGINQRALSYSSTDDAPIPVIQNDFISVSATYQTIGLNPKKVRMTVNFDIFTNLNDSLLTIGLSFADYVDNYYNLYTSVLEIIQFGGMSLYGGGSQFAGLTPQILISAPDQPRIIPGTSALNCFMDCTNFNSPAIINWNIANIVNMSGMFQGATIFNQDISVWDTSNVADMSFMFESAIAFNNGQSGTMDISGNPFTGAFYTNSTQVLTSPNSKFLTQLSSVDVLIITAGSVSSPTLIYTSQINPPIISDISLVLLTPNPNFLNISSPTIISIKKQVAGSAPLTWNTSNVTTMNFIFNNATFFNQRVDTWDVSKVTDMESAFQGFQDPIVYTTVLFNVFNNGQLSGSSVDTSLNKWNTGNVTNMSYMFSLASGFNQYISAWNTSKVTTIAGMFYKGLIFNNGLASGVASNDASLNSWDTSKVTTMQSVFQEDAAFNQKVSSWDVSKVTNMNTMFYLATTFNNGDSGNLGSKSLNSWTAPLCTDFTLMFQQASAFNQNVSNLVNTSGLTTPSGCTMASMFRLATVFNNGSLLNDGSNNLNSWDTSKVTSMGSMFQNSVSFNQPIGDWNTSLVTIMQSMFQTASLFNQPLTTDGNKWNVSNVTTFFNMFSSATTFNQYIGNWNTSSATSMASMFFNAQVFNNGQTGTMDISGTSFIYTNSTRILTSTGSKFLTQLLSTDVLIITTGSIASPTILYTSQIQPPILSDVSLVLLTANGSAVTPITSVKKQVVGTADLSWNTTNVTSINGIFSRAPYFNQRLPWDVSNVTDMGFAFNGNITALKSTFNNGQLAGSSSQPLTNASLVPWSPTKCTSFNSTFLNTAGFNQPMLNFVDTSGIILDGSGNGVNLSGMFQSATRFNQNLNTWNTSKVSNMSSVFSTTSVFNNGDASGASTQPLNWITDNVTTMSAMFVNALVFNQPIDTSGNYWNTGKVTTMVQMLAGGSVTLLFNQPIGRWDVSNCTTMTQMFYGANKFNQNISLWKTGNVTTMSQMFRSATLFNQTINTDATGSWDVSKVTDMSSMFSGASAFNNGQTGTVDISGNLITSSASYINSSKLLTCPVGNFTTLTSANVLIITTPTLVYSSQIQTTPISDVSLVLLTAYGANILSGITSIKKQVAGTADLSWNTQLVTTTANMFQNATYFNQRLPWNMRLNRNVTSMFAGTATTFINLFNNGQILTGTTQPLYPGGGANIWDFSGGTITGGTTNAWHINSRLTSANGVTANPPLTF